MRRGVRAIRTQTRASRGPTRASMQHRIGDGADADRATSAAWRAAGGSFGIMPGSYVSATHGQNERWRSATRVNWGSRPIAALRTSARLRSGESDFDAIQRHACVRNDVHRLTESPPPVFVCLRLASPPRSACIGEPVHRIASDGVTSASHFHDGPSRVLLSHRKLRCRWGWRRRWSRPGCCGGDRWAAHVSGDLCSLALAPPQIGIATPPTLPPPTTRRVATGTAC